MSFTRLSYEKDWTNPADFPTFEDSESQVREDFQFHPNAIRDYLNNVLLETLESDQGAGNIGSASGEALQTVVSQCVSDIQTLAAGGVPSVSQCVQVAFDQGDWTETAVESDEDDAETVWTLTIGQLDHRRYGAAYGFNLWQMVNGALCNDTWGVAATCVAAPRAEDGSITLTAPKPYTGAIAFFGV